MKDFTLDMYRVLIERLTGAGYSFQRLEDYVEEPMERVVIIRHDVDRNPEKSLIMAQLEAKYGIESSYYFRSVSHSWNIDIVKKISDLGHEIGYHYENLSNQAKKLRMRNNELKTIDRTFKKFLQNTMEKNESSSVSESQNFESAFKSLDRELRSKADRLFEESINAFQYELTEMRKIVSIKTIAMHGSPLVPIDNRFLWLRYDYRDYGIKIEPYFDLNFEKMLYFTDAGRSWIDSRANLRDRVDNSLSHRFRKTEEIIKAVEDKKLPDQIMINIHPEHWTDNDLDWWKIWGVRKIKNLIKRAIY